MKEFELHPAVERVLVSEEDIQNAVKEIAKKINADYQNEPVLLLVILKGSLVFASDLMRHLNMPVSLDFMQASSYGNQTVSQGFINIKRDMETDVRGKNVIIVEDIIDSGNTLFKIKALLSERNAKSVRICTILDKPERRVADIDVDYQGIVIPDEFAVGYGLDYNEDYRHLPYIGVLKREIYIK